MGTSESDWHWSPEPEWLWLSVLGMTVGGFLGATYVVVLTVVTFTGAGVNGDPDGTLMGLLGLAVFGVVIGSLVGATGGLAVGLVLTFLVGRRMPGHSASVLTFAGAAVTAALVSWPVLGQVLGLDARDDSRALAYVSASAVIAGLVALWFRHQLPRPAAEVLG